MSDQSYALKIFYPCTLKRSRAVSEDLTRSHTISTTSRHTGGRCEYLLLCSLWTGCGGPICFSSLHLWDISCLQKSEKISFIFLVFLLLRSSLVTQYPILTVTQEFLTFWGKWVPVCCADTFSSHTRSHVLVCPFTCDTGSHTVYTPFLQAPEQPTLA